MEDAAAEEIKEELEVVELREQDSSVAIAADDIEVEIEDDEE